MISPRTWQRRGVEQSLFNVLQLLSSAAKRAAVCSVVILVHLQCSPPLISVVAYLGDKLTTEIADRFYVALPLLALRTTKHEVEKEYDNDRFVVRQNSKIKTVLTSYVTSQKPKGGFGQDRLSPS